MQNSNLGNYYALKGGIAIPEGADLNNYITPGNYYCESDAKARTLLNCPIANGFTLKVEYAIGTGYPCQTIRQYDIGKKMYHVKFPDGWNEWRENIINSDFTDKTVIGNRGVVTTNANQPLGLFINTTDKNISLYLNSELIGKINYQ